MYGLELFAFYSEMFVTTVVNNMEDIMDKKNYILPSNLNNPLQSGCLPKLYFTTEIKVYGVKYY